MNKSEEIKKAVCGMKNITAIKIDCINKGFNGLRIIKDRRVFYIGKSEYLQQHIYCDWIDGHWMIDYRFYSVEDIVHILELLFNLLPKYDCNSKVAEMKSLAHELYLDTIEFEDDDEWDILVTVLTKNFIGKNNLNDDEFGVLYLVIEHTCLNAILGFWPDKQQKKH